MLIFNFVQRISYVARCLQRLAGYSNPENDLLFIALLIFRIHGQESKDEEIHRGGDDRQSEEDENQREDHIFRLILEGSALLKGYKITES